ncbi:hypothetical protein IAD21_05680 [Abditibacteriota bacterium]|nr:hypothetical protein IAD21_05680 [Abditibacteriota bacterium]
MPLSRVNSGFLPLLALLAASPPLWAAPVASSAKPMMAPAAKAMDAPADDAKWHQPLTGAPAALHVLNRLAFGPLPGQIEDVQQIGIRQWIETQLQPKLIDDSAVETKLAGFTLIKAKPENLMLMYQGDNNAIRRYLEMQDPNSKQRARLEAVAAQNTQNGANGAMPAPDGTAPPKSRLDRALNERQQEMLKNFQDAGMTQGVSIRAAGELVQAKLVRAVESKRQLQEVLADFWNNHFNIDMRKKAGRTLKVIDDRDAIRPHMFGSFRELLGASAHSPAMMIYLDNASSTVAMKARGGKTRGGLNENYARELMELHTLGVDGGYTQTDVTEVARCFTGWSIEPQNGTFVFRPRVHDNDEKHVLGRTIAANGGQRDGEQVLDMLASSPSTAKFLSLKLCQRFVADEPPAQLVDRIAQTWTRTNGDLPSVYRALFLSPEFLSAGAYRAKIKSPFEYTVSAVRALGGQVSVPDEKSPVDKLRLTRIGSVSANQGAKGGKANQKARAPLAIEIATLGQPVFACLPPTGWSEDSSSWVSAGAIVGRLNFALSLTSGTVADVRLSTDTFRAAPLDQLSKQLVGGQLSDATRATVARETAAVPTDGAKMRALILGSPEFQRR